MTDMTTAVSTGPALSGLYYPNRMGRLLLSSLEEIMGRNGLHTLLRQLGLRQYVDNFPPEDLQKQFDFAHFTAVCAGLEDMMGVRGGRGLALRAGRVCFRDGLKGFGALAGAGDLAFRVLPLTAKIKIGLPALAAIFTNFSDQVTRVEEFSDHYKWVIEKCPCCWGRKTDKPVCFAATGVLQEGMRWVSGGLEFRVQQVKCHAMGDQFCEFTIFKEPIGQ